MEMAFKLKKGLHHSPDWYEKHCHDEDGGSAVWRAMFNHDVKYIDAPTDNEMRYLEKVSLYRQRWDEILSGQRLDGRTIDTELVLEMSRIVESELGKGFFRVQEYQSKPFRSFDRLMEKHDISEASVREFLKWRIRREVTKKRKSTKPKASKEKLDGSPTRDFLKRKMSKFFGGS